MSIYLGNLSTKEIADRLSIQMTDEDIKKMEEFRCQKGNVGEGKWHCFDRPFICVCGDIDTAVKVRDIMRNYSSDIKGVFRIEFTIGRCRKKVSRND